MATVTRPPAQKGEGTQLKKLKGRDLEIKLNGKQLNQITDKCFHSLWLFLSESPFLKLGQGQHWGWTLLGPTLQVTGCPSMPLRGSPVYAG